MQKLESTANHLFTYLYFFQEPEEKQIGDPYPAVQFTGSKRREILRYDTFHYIPLLKTLEVLLQDESIQEEVHNCSARIRNDGKLEDFCDGSVFKQHELFSSNPEALQIVGYYDELEITNPIGAYVKRRKVGVVFFMLANVHPRFRSRLQSVNLVAVARAEHVDKHGINDVLDPFIQDLNCLAENGISVCVNGVSKHFKGALLAFLADTQASHLVGGFKKSVGSAYRMCRTCMATTDTFRVKFNSNDFQRRSTAAHIVQCDSLEGALRDHNSKVYGINCKSILLNVKLFSMCDWGLPHDVMHDLFEGVVQYELKLLLLHCIGERYFSLADFNKRLLGFEYGYSEVADKPVPLTTQHVHSKDGKHLRQGSAQTWLLARIFPFLVAGDITESDLHWKCFLMLLRIIDITLAPVVTVDVCAVLKILIEEHHEMFTTLYPDWTVTPKMHYMTHYPEQILALGPLVRAWTMRYEAKLCLLKHAGRVSNFKNISQTISTRHQRWICYEFSSGGVLSSTAECGPVCVKTTLSDETASVKEQISNLVLARRFWFLVLHGPK